MSTDKTSYLTGESPQFSVVEAKEFSPIYWSSTRNGVSMGESNAFYGNYPDGNGNWSGGGAAWTANDVGGWTKTVSVGGQSSTVSFQVTAALPQPSSLNLRSNANLLYVSAELNYGGDRYAEMRARAGALGPWEQWTVVPLNGTDVALRSVANGKYVSAELGYPGDRYGTLRARADAIGPWEVFTSSTAAPPPPPPPRPPPICTPPLICD